MAYTQLSSAAWAILLSGKNSRGEDAHRQLQTALLDELNPNSGEADPLLEESDAAPGAAAAAAPGAAKLPEPPAEDEGPEELGIEEPLPAKLPGVVPAATANANGSPEQPGGDNIGWRAGAGQPPDAWFECTAGARVLALLEGTRASARRQHRQTVRRIEEAHARLVTEMGAARDLDVARTRDLVATAAAALREAAEGGTHGALSLARSFGNAATAAVAAVFGQEVERAIAERDAAHRAQLAALAAEQKATLDAQRTAAAAEKQQALSRQWHELSTQHDSETTALKRASDEKARATEADRARSRLLLEHARGERDTLREQLAACQREAQGWRARWERECCGAAGTAGVAGRRRSSLSGAARGAAPAAGATALAVTSGADQQQGSRGSSGSGVATAAAPQPVAESASAGLALTTGSAAAEEPPSARELLLSELSRLQAQHAAELARRDAVMARCREAILALEAQLTEARRAAAAGPQQAPAGPALEARREG